MDKFKLDAAAVKYARRALSRQPESIESEQLLEVALASADDEGTMAFLRKGLDVSPSLLPWHLYYQNYMQVHHPEHNLEREYTAYCKKHENDASCYYLLARVVNDRSNAYQFYEFSDRQGGMEGKGLYAIAKDRWLRGEFSEALPYVQRAMKLAPNNGLYAGLEEQILLALRDYDTLLANALSGEAGGSTERRAEKTVLYLTCAGYHKQASDKIADVGGRQSAELPRLNAIRYYSVGNIPDYLECLEEMHNPHTAMEKLLHAEQIANVDNLISQKVNHPYWEHLVIYCAAMGQNQHAIAERNWGKAIAEVGTQSNDHNRLARLLEGTELLGLDTVRSLDIDATEKTVLCVALGYRYPEMQQQLHDLALTYNFTPAYPQILVKKWVRNATTARNAKKELPSQTIALGL